MEERKLQGGTLVVLPKSIMSQWAQELHDKVRASLVAFPGTGTALNGHMHPHAFHTICLEGLPCLASVPCRLYGLLPMPENAASLPLPCIAPVLFKALLFRRWLQSGACMCWHTGIRRACGTAMMLKPWQDTTSCCARTAAWCTTAPSRTSRAASSSAHEGSGFRARGASLLSMTANFLCCGLQFSGLQGSVAVH